MHGSHLQHSSARLLLAPVESLWCCTDSTDFAHSQKINAHRLSHFFVVGMLWFQHLYMQTQSVVLHITHALCYSTSCYSMIPMMSNSRYLQGSWQIPLHMTGPSREDPTFHGASLKEAPRVTCSSLLIRILSMGAARAALRRKTPAYADR